MIRMLGLRAKSAAALMGRASSELRDRALLRIAELLIEREEQILAANEADLELAAANGLKSAMLERLSLARRLEGMAQDVRAVAAFPDPIGEVIEERTLESGLLLSKRRTPIGVLGVIYESRPNVTIDIAALTIKSGNCAILRGGKEALKSNHALAEIVRTALSEVGLPEDAVQLVATPEREQVLQMLKLSDCIDLIIPRGGNTLHLYCREHSTIPVITGGIGVCHLYVDCEVDVDRAIDVIINAKTQRPTVCNSLDTCLIHRGIASEFLSRLAKKIAPFGVTFSCDAEAKQVLESQGFEVQLAKPEDWDTEWLSLMLGIRIVDDLSQAIAHIQAHSTAHSDGILTNNPQHAEQFVNAIDSAAVYVNASTRFTDGAQFGLGAEVAVSTQKVHARGPMGVREVTSYKWIVRGQYTIREG